MMRVEVKPELLRWAVERARVAADDLERRFPMFGAWESEARRPTFAQLERFAEATHTPIGYFFLPRPPVEEVPIPDFRTFLAERIERPSPDLLDTVYICQQRQEWYRDFARSMREEPFSFVGSASLAKGIVEAANAMRSALRFDIDVRREMPTWTEALRHFIDQADQLGVLVMVSGVVGSNNKRKLVPEEFRGFALSDDLAPLVFINGADTKAAQMFTLAHELAHVFLGQSALSNAEPVVAAGRDVEKWCNRVAAELLVPLAALREEYRKRADLRGELDRLARYFKVSTLVVLRRIHDVGGLTRDELWHAYGREVARLQTIPRASGGNFYLTQAARVSKRFARALVFSTLEGQTLHRDAFRLLGVSKLATFRQLGHSLGIT